MHLIGKREIVLPFFSFPPGFEQNKRDVIRHPLNDFHLIPHSFLAGLITCQHLYCRLQNTTAFFKFGEHTLVIVIGGSILNRHPVQLHIISWLCFPGYQLTGVQAIKAVSETPTVGLTHIIKHKSIVSSAFCQHIYDWNFFFLKYSKLFH